MTRHPLHQALTRCLPVLSLPIPPRLRTFVTAASALPPATTHRQAMLDACTHILSSSSAVAIDLSDPTSPFHWKPLPGSPRADQMLPILLEDLTTSLRAPESGRKVRAGVNGANSNVSKTSLAAVVLSLLLRSDLAHQSIAPADSPMGMHDITWSSKTKNAVGDISLPPEFFALSPTTPSLDPTSSSTTVSSLTSPPPLPLLNTSILSTSLIPAGTRTAPHTDALFIGGPAHPLSGLKLWIFFAPTTENLRTYLTHYRGAAPPPSREFIDFPDPPHWLVTRGGDSLYVPPGWIHLVYTAVSSVSYSGWILKIEEGRSLKEMARMGVVELVRGVSAGINKRDRKELMEFVTLGLDQWGRVGLSTEASAVWQELTRELGGVV